MLIWLAYFLLPNGAGGFVHGIPLGPVEAAALLMIAWLARVGTRLPGTPIVAALLAVTFIAGAAIPGASGFRARYFPNASASGPHERSTEFRSETFTRIDRRLEFSPDGPEVPLPFINHTNLNFYKAGEPNRRYLPFAVRWSGLWWADEERPRLYLDAPSATGEIFIDGELALEVSPTGGSPVILEVPVTRGWHRLDVTFASPYGSPRVFSSGVMDGDRRRPFDATMVLTQQVRPWQMTAARVLHRSKAAIDVALIGSLAWLVITSLVQILRTQRARVLWLFSAAAATEAYVFAFRWSRHNMVLTGGDDTLTYEGYARDILLNGILMNGGLPPGQGEPFYYQAGYPYFLAAAHALFGESMFGPVLLQRLLAAVAMWKVVEIAVAWTNERIWVVALPIAVSFVAWKFWPIAAQPLNESLYVPLLLASAAALIHLCAEPRRRRALAAGLLTGLATVTRSTALIAWVVVWPACWLALNHPTAQKPRGGGPGGRPRRGAVMAVLVASMLSVFSLITIRNWIVADVFAPMPTELGITLRGGNEVPPDVAIDLTTRSAMYQRFNVNEHTATVIEYAITAPGRFAQNLGRKALFALGFYEPYAPGWGYSPVYIAVWTSAVAGLFLLLKTKTALSERVPYLIPAMIALTQFMAVVIVYPRGERLIVPIHALLLPYSAVAAWHLAQRAAALRRRRPAASPA